MHEIKLGTAFYRTDLTISLMSISLMKRDIYLTIDCACVDKGSIKKQCKLGEMIVRCDSIICISEIKDESIIIQITKKKKKNKRKNHQAKWRSKYGLS